MRLFISTSFVLVMLPLAACFVAVSLALVGLASFCCCSTPPPQNKPEHGAKPKKIHASPSRCQARLINWKPETCLGGVINVISVMKGQLFPSRRLTFLPVQSYHVHFTRLQLTNSSLLFLQISIRYSFLQAVSFTFLCSEKRQPVGEYHFSIDKNDD